MKALRAKKYLTKRCKETKKCSKGITTMSSLHPSSKPSSDPSSRPSIPSQQFDSRSPELKGNTRDWPKFPKTPSKSKPLCLRYQPVGQGKSKCFLAHIDPFKVENAVRATFNTQFQSIYS